MNGWRAWNHMDLCDISPTLQESQNKKISIAWFSIKSFVFSLILLIIYSYPSRENFTKMSLMPLWVSPLGFVVSDLLCLWTSLPAQWRGRRSSTPGLNRGPGPCALLHCDQWMERCSASPGRRSTVLEWQSRTPLRNLSGCCSPDTEPMAALTGGPP